VARSSSIAPTAGATTRIALGGDAARGATENFFGSVYFVRVYNRALSAVEAKANYEVLAGLGGPYGWNPIADPADGTPLVIKAAGDTAPVTFDLTPFLPEVQDYFLRAYCSTVQTATNDLEFAWRYR